MRILAWTAAVTLVLDQVSKVIVVWHLDLATRGAIEVLPPFLNFRMAWNRGVNFGLMAGGEATRWLLVALALAIATWVAVWLVRAGAGRWPQVAGGLLIGGAVGNSIDRVLYGAVADFLNMSCCGIENPYAFNVADIAIFAGAIGLALLGGGSAPPPPPPKRREPPPVTAAHERAKPKPDGRGTPMRSAMILGTVLALGACERGEPDLINFRASNRSPDEFSVLPTQPLTLEGLPQDAASLPPPTPGAGNRTDPAPVADAYAALGGNIAAANRPADGGIVNYAARGGISPGIRGELAADDARFRQTRRGRLLERLFGVSTYYDAYGAQSLDQYRELQRIRSAGLRNPSAPPADVELPRRPTVTDGPSFYDPSPAISGE